MKRIQAIVSVIAVLLALLWGCAGQPNQEMNILGVELNSLTTAAQGYEAYMHPDPRMGDREFLENATAGDPSLLAPFEGYVLHVERAGGWVGIIVCTRDGEGVLQDAGCTPELDRRLWEDGPISCGRVPSVLSVCGPARE
ncbi:hypothetical protein [uncultured Pseudodesulfovibrio sp.]|uniref:hypothetical protein n=1 Tax=uncultured Pseudodesulfovibrio sp. TaxID=2035858 RepID=UPI0029C7BD1F|nr:hypothetical protein [uncultured Pseudodesulfovibrio sp.]